MTTPDTHGKGGVLDTVLNKLCKWRTFFASWQVGTRPANDGESRAIRHHFEMTILLRAELSCMANMLIEKGVCTRDEWCKQLIIEAQALDAMYASAHPGWTSSLDGMIGVMPEAAETMVKMNFPP